jgi:protocatechuate 3,4-dioxygenase beta subunit
VLTGEDGRFEFGPLAPGSYELRTMQPMRFDWDEPGESWAEAELVGVTLREAQQLSGVELQLRVGGTIHGVIYDREGRPEFGRTIMISLASGYGLVPNATSDEQGEFVVERLEPGTYQLVSEPDLSELQGDDSDTTPAELLSSIAFAAAQVVDGEVTEVTLGAPPEEPVRVSGRVTQAGTPCTGGQIGLVTEGESLLSGLVVADCDADGRYELIAKQAGRATLIFSNHKDGLWGSEIPIDIPEVSEWTYDVEVPSGMIHGRVVDGDGDPLQAVVVGLENRGGLPAIAGFGRGAMTMTDENGYFVFDGLAAGIYDVRAGGELSPMRKTLFAKHLVSGIELEADGAHEIEIVLLESGRLVGVVLDQYGRPVPDAGIFVRDANGNLLSRVSGFSTDANGYFEYLGLPFGEVFVEARGRTTVSRAQSAHVTNREPKPIELRLESGSTLTVRGEDSDGNPARLRLSVLDEAGREHCGMLSETELQTRFATGINSAERTIGPLLPGKYIVTGSDDHGRSRSRKVTLRADQERMLRLRVTGD